MSQKSPEKETRGAFVLATSRELVRLHDDPTAIVAAHVTKGADAR